jgi:hypothetical protein
MTYINRLIGAHPGEVTARDVWGSLALWIALCGAVLAAGVML